MKRKMIDAVPPTPERYLRKMNDTLKEITTMKYRAKATRRASALVIAAILVLAIAGMAIAAGRTGILDRLFQGSDPNPAVEKALVRNAASDAKEGVTLTMDEHLLDDTSAIFQWSVASNRDEPVYYVHNYEIRGEGGESPVLVSASDRTVGEMMALDGAQPIGIGRAHSSYISGNIDEPLKAAITITITVDVYTSDYPMQLLRPGLLSGEVYPHPDERQLRQLSDEKQIGVDSGGVCHLLQYPDVQSALDKAEKQYPSNWDAYNRDAVNFAFEKTGWMKPLTQLVITLTIDPNARGERHTAAAQAGFDVQNGKLALEAVDFAQSATRIAYRYYPDQVIAGNETADGWGDMDDYGRYEYAVVAPDETILTTALMLNTYSEPGEDEHGRYIRVELWGLPAATVPEYILLVPIGDEPENATDMTVAQYHAALIADARPEDMLRVEVVK